MSEEKELQERTTDPSGSYPSETIDDCKNIVKQVYDSKGDDFVSTADIAVIVGKARPTMILKVSACVQYGLLKNVYKKGYHATKLFQSIVSPEYDHLVRNYLLEAFGNPPLYRKLIERYNGSVLPNVHGLANILSSFGIHENSRLKAASVFLENCKNLSLVENGRLRYFIPAVNGTATPVKNEEEESELGRKNSTSDISVPPLVNSKMFKLPIDLGEKTAYLEYPRDISTDEISILKIMVDAQLSALEKRQKKNLANNEA
jgi:hypothetical protein